MSNGTTVQIFAALFIALGNFSMAYMSVWPSYTLKVFQSHHSPLSGNVTKSQENLIGSVPMLGSMVGTIFGGILADGVGRKRGEILCGLILVLSASLLCTARNATLLIIARCMLGLGSGLHTSIFAIFIGEFSSLSIRGTLMSIGAFGFCLGVLVSYITGWLCNYYLNNYIFLSLNVAFVVFMCWLHDTPIYLLRKGHDKEALKALKFYRGTKVTSQKILDELAEINNLLLPQKMTMKEPSHDDPEKETLQNPDTSIKDASSTSAWKALLTSQSSMRALITVASLIAIDVSMGMVTVQTYAGVLFTSAVPNLSADLCSIALAIANIIGSCLPVFFSDCVGRRVLMMTSAALVSGCLVALGVLVRWSIAPDWMMPAMILIYCFCFQLGAGSIPFVLTAECFLPEVKTLCIVICLSTMWVANFINLAVFGLLVGMLGLHGTFFMYSVIAASMVVLTYLFMPETMGLSTESIQKKFSQGCLQVGRSTKMESNK